MEIRNDSGAASPARAQVEVDVGQQGVERAAAQRTASASPPSGSARALGAAWNPLAGVVALMPQRPSFSIAADAFATAPGYAPSATSSTPEPTAHAAPEPSFAHTAAAQSASGKASGSRTTHAKSASSKNTSSRSSSSKAESSKTSTSRELAFLDSKTMSIEDKLFQFMLLMQQKSDKDLEQAMKEYDAKKTASSSSSTSSGSPGAVEKPEEPDKPEKHDSGGGGGLFGFVGDALGGIARGIGGVVESAAKELGGPLLAAGVTALGAPWLAPVALGVGGGLASGLVHSATTALAGSSPSPSRASAGSGGSSASSSTSAKSSSSANGASSAKSSPSSSSSAASDATFDERSESMKLQRLVDKQQQMFSTISNVLKAMHDAQMTAIGNIR